MTDRTDSPIPVHIAFVLDASGSMGSVRQATVEGVNAFLAEQRAEPGDAWISLTLFDTALDPRYVAWGIADLPELGSEANRYSPGGGTALFDAVGVTILGTERWLASNGWFGDRGGRILLVILTDGQENSSREFTQEKVNGLLKSKQDEGWDVQFLGSGGSGWLEATFGASVGLDNIGSYVHDAAGTQASYAAMSAEIGAVRRTGKRMEKWTPPADGSTS